MMNDIFHCLREGALCLSSIVKVCVSVIICAWVNVKGHICVVGMS